MKSQSRRRFIHWLGGAGAVGVAGCSGGENDTREPTSTDRTPTTDQPQVTDTLSPTEEPTETLESEIERLEQLDQEIQQLATSDRIGRQEDRQAAVQDVVAKVEELKTVLQAIEADGHEIIPTFEDGQLKLVINSPAGSFVFGSSMTLMAIAMASYLVGIGALNAALSSQFVSTFVTSLRLPQLLAQTTTTVLRYAWLNYFGLNPILQSDLKNDVTQNLVDRALDNIEDDLQRDIILSPERDEIAALLILESIHVIYTEDLQDELQDVTLALLEFIEAIKWRNDLNWAGTTFTNVGDSKSKWITAEEIIIEPVKSGSETVYAPDDQINLNLRVRETTTDKSITIETKSGPQRYTIQRIEFESVYRGTGEIRNNPSIQIVPEPDESTELETTVSGDRNMFRGSTFFEHTVEVLDGTDLLGKTEKRPIGIGYEAEFEQEGETVRITRDNEVNPEWFVEFYLHRPDKYEKLGRTSVTNQEGDDMFTISVGDMDVDPGEYSWTLTIFEDSDDSLGERIIEINPFPDRDRVSIG